MSDRIYISGDNGNVKEGRYYELPSRYDNGFYHNVTPYAFQDFISSILEHNKSLINSEINESIKGEEEDEENVQWLKIINTKDFTDNDLNNATFQKDYVEKFGKWVNKNFKFGQKEIITDINNNQDIIFENINFGIFWNNIFCNYFGIWYTGNNESYIAEDLIEATNYYLEDKNNCIIRVVTDLGFSILDIQSINNSIKNNQPITNPQYELKLHNLTTWGDRLKEVQIFYKLLKQRANKNYLNNYLFIDEDKTIFNESQKSYFLFKPTDNYYGDLNNNILNKQLKYWKPTYNYKVGDIVLGAETRNYNYIYCCLLDHTSNEDFEKTVIRDNNGISTIVTQWECISTDYAKEIEALKKAFGNNFNPENYIRFSIPDLLGYQKANLNISGEIEEIDKSGEINFQNEQDGCTLREIRHKDYSNELKEAIKDYTNNDNFFENSTFEEQRTVIQSYLDNQEITNKPVNLYKEYTNYLNIIETALDDDENERLDPYLVSEEDWINQLNEKTSSVSTNSTSYFEVDKKIVRYFHKGILNNLVPVNIISNLTSLKEKCFKDREDLLKVVLSSGITKIENKAFSGCINLYQAILPKNLEILGNGAFAGCQNLWRATIPPKVRVLNGTYAGCSNLLSIVLPPITAKQGCLEIGSSTFVNCKKLKNIFNIDKIQVIGMEAFSGCESLEKFKINNKISELPARAFKNCKICKFDLTDIGIITLLGEGCFEGCEELTEQISFVNLDELYPNTYKNCKNLTSITFEFKDKSNEEIEYIEGVAKNKYIIPVNFCYGCSKLTTINFDDKLQELDDSCFENCASLSKVTIPDNVNFIGKRVFYDCFHMGEVEIPRVYVLRNGEEGTISNYTSWIDKVINYENSEVRNNWIDRAFTRIKIKEVVQNG